MSRRSEIAAVLLQHTFDGEIGECVCGFAGRSTLALVSHIAAEIEAVLDGAA